MAGVTMRLGHAQQLQVGLGMRAALRQLQMSNLDLAAEILAEVSANPMLEAVYPLARGLGVRGGPESEADGGRVSEGMEPPDRAETLVEHLSRQLVFTRLDGFELFLARALIGELDADGYLRVDLGAVAGRLGAETADIERVMRRLRSLEPTGVFARDLPDCLALQLAERGRLDRPMRALLARLDLVAKGDLPRIAAVLGRAPSAVEVMVAELRGLTPRPGLAFAFEPPGLIVPEVRVSHGPDGDWLVEPWSPHLPRIVVGEERFRRMLARCRRVEDVDYMNERISAARRFADLIARRGRTVLNVASEIVRRQGAFMEQGVRGLKPLMLKTVAEALDLHESTVSRAAANKAMLTPRGVVMFKAFFVGAAPTLDGSELTRPRVVGRIAAMIADEARSGAVMSDAAISDALAREGVKIARRTVAKHREALGVPTGARRRRIGAAAMARKGEPAVGTVSGG